MELYVLRGSSVVTHFQIDERTVLVQKLYGENYIQVAVETREPLNLAIGDKIAWNAVWYYLNTEPNVQKTSSRSYAYSMVFESQFYDLAKAAYLFDDQEAEFDLNMDVPGFLDLLVANLNRVFGAGVWTRGACDQTDTSLKLMHFAQKNCTQVLLELCNEFDGEAYFVKRVLRFTQRVGSNTGWTLEYRAGLYGFTRNLASPQNVVTRLYPFGSQQNLDTTYGATRLRIADQDPPNSVYYLEQNVADYGLVEGVKVWDDVFPTRTGTVTWVHPDTPLGFIDSGMDFDINSYLLAGVPAKVHFQTGDLAGYEFEISDYFDGSNLFVIVATTDRQGLTMPSVTLKPQVGDTYKLVDITLPASYVTAAETSLETKATAWLTENSSPRAEYTLQPDWRFLRTRNIVLKIGDKLTVDDVELGISSLQRIVSIQRPLLNQWKVALEVTNHPQAPLLQRTTARVKSATDAVEYSGSAKVIPHRREWLTPTELQALVYDPDGYFDMGNIRPLSVTTAMLSVGIGSSQFTLPGVIIQPNYTGDASKLEASAGSLVHFTIDSVVRTWTLQANSYSGLTAGTPYYLYAKCDRDDYVSANNKIVLDSSALLTDDDPDYWYFLVGVLHAVSGTTRALSFTYGQTTVNGAFIKTGRISSASGATYFDLDNNVLVIASGAGTIAGTNITAIQNGATAGATWDVNVASVPYRLTAPDAPLIDTVAITPNYIGFFDADTGTWPVRIKNNAGSGEFYCGDATHFMSYAAGALTVQGKIQTAASGARMVVDNSDNTIKLYDSTGTNVFKIDDNIISGPDQGILIATESIAGDIAAMIYLYGDRDYGIGINEANGVMITGFNIQIKGPGPTSLLRLYNTYAPWMGDYIWGIDENLNIVFRIYNDGTIVTATGLIVGANQVIGAQGAAVANATDAPTTMARLNDLLARCRAHGLIAT